MQRKERRALIAALGYELNPQVLARCQALYADEQLALADTVSASAVDLAYGPAPRHRLDLYAPQGTADGAASILVFVHGGGFVRGDKGTATSWMNANVGRMAARAGFLGVVINYRLAPEHAWPAGGEDVAATVDWLKAHACSHGGDPDRIVLMGTSAGAVHIATYLQLRPDVRELRGAVLLSGLYGCTPLEERDVPYYGAPSQYAARCPLDAVTETDIPLLLACAEFDPPRFQSEFVGLLQRRIERHGYVPRACIVSGHNHYTLALHIGSADTRLADEIVAFAREQCA